MNSTSIIKGLKRNDLEKFYTKQTSVKICIDNIKKYIDIGKNDFVIEPSAGNGAFIDSIKTITDNYVFYDIKPEHDEILQLDFLKFEPSQHTNLNNTNIHIIGNPPFGRQASLAKQFIKKSCHFAKSISFILPKSFRKDSMKNTFSLNYHMLVEVELPTNSFTIDKQEIDVPCVFQIWVYKDTPRSEEKKASTDEFIFVCKNNNPDIAFRRVGVNAGQVFDSFNNQSIQSHYFIKFTDRTHIKQKIEKIKMLKFNHNNTVGPKSISKQELIKEFNRIN